MCARVYVWSHSILAAVSITRLQRSAYNIQFDMQYQYSPKDYAYPKQCTYMRASSSLDDNIQPSWGPNKNQL